MNEGSLVIDGSIKLKESSAWFCEAGDVQARMSVGRLPAIATGVLTSIPAGIVGLGPVKFRQ